MQNILAKALSHLVVAEEVDEQLAELYLLLYHSVLNYEAEAGSDEKSFHRKRIIELANQYEEKYQVDDWEVSDLFGEKDTEIEAWAQREDVKNPGGEPLQAPPGAVATDTGEALTEEHESIINGPVENVSDHFDAYFDRGFPGFRIDYLLKVPEDNGNGNQIEKELLEKIKDIELKSLIHIEGIYSETHEGHHLMYVKYYVREDKPLNVEEIVEDAKKIHEALAERVAGGTLTEELRERLLEAIKTDDSDKVREVTDQIEDPNLLENLYENAYSLFPESEEFDLNYDNLLAVLGHNPYTPVKILKKLATEGEAYVRRAVARNPNTPVETLKKLAEDDNHPNVRNDAKKALEERAGETTPVGTTLTEAERQAYRNRLDETGDDDDDLILEIISEINDPDFLKKLAEVDYSYDNHWNVRWEVAQNPNTPVETLKKLAEDDGGNVRWRVAQNPNTPVETLKKLAEDDNRPNVRNAAKKALEERADDTETMEYLTEAEAAKLFKEVEKLIDIGNDSGEHWDRYDGVQGVYKGPADLSKQDFLDKSPFKVVVIDIVQVENNDEDADPDNAVFYSLTDNNYLLSSYYSSYLDHSDLPQGTTAQDVVDKFKEAEAAYEKQVLDSAGLKPYEPTFEDIKIWDQYGSDDMYGGDEEALDRLDNFLGYTVQNMAKTADKETIKKLVLETKYPDRAIKEINDIDLLKELRKEESLGRNAKELIFEKIQENSEGDEIVEVLIKAKENEISAPQIQKLFDKLNQEDFLLQIENDADAPEIRLEAIKRMTDVDTLTNIALTDEPEIAQIALEKIPAGSTDALKEIVNKTEADAIKYGAVIKLENSDDPAFWGKQAVELYKEVEENGWTAGDWHKDFLVKAQEIIVKNMKDEASFKKIFDTNPPEAIQELAIRNITDRETLLKIATDEGTYTKTVQQLATDKLTDYKDLLAVVQNGQYGHAVAILKIKDMIAASEDKKFLKDIFSDDDLSDDEDGYEYQIMETALKRLVSLGADKKLINEIARDDGWPTSFKEIVLYYVEDDDILYDIVIDENRTEGIRYKAWELIKDDETKKKALLNMTGAGDVFDWVFFNSSFADQDFLLKLIKEADDPWLKSQAIDNYKGEDDELFKKLVKEYKGKDDEIFLNALWKIKKEGNEEYFKELYDPDYRLDDDEGGTEAYFSALVRGINDEEFLKKMLVEMPSAGDFVEAAKKIKDEQFLKEFAIKSKFNEFSINIILTNVPEDIRNAFNPKRDLEKRLPAIQKLNPKDFMLVLKNTTGNQLDDLVKKITDEDVLYSLAVDPQVDISLRVLATRGIKDLEKNKKLLGLKGLASQVSVNFGRYHREELLNNDEAQLHFIRTLNNHVHFKAERGLAKIYTKIVYKAASEDNYDLLKLLSAEQLRNLGIKLPSFEQELPPESKDAGHKVPAHKQQLLRLLLTLAKPA